MNYNPSAADLKKWSEEHATLKKNQRPFYPLDGGDAKVFIYGTDDDLVEARLNGIPDNWKNFVFKVYEETGLAVNCYLVRQWKRVKYSSCIIIRTDKTVIKLMDKHEEITTIEFCLQTESRNDAFEKFRKIYRAML